MKLYLAILLVVTGIIGKAQNLVPNYSFENLNYCPNSNTDYSAIPNWYSVQQNSPDFYNVCITYSGGVPYNFVGYQEPQQGDGYAGVVLFVNNLEYREYIAVKLTEPLLPTIEYCVSFYVSAADSAGLQTNTIGAYIGDSIYPQQPYWVRALPYTPQIQSSQYIENNTGWQLIEGSFVAQGGEQYLTIGSFTTDPNTTWGPNSATLNQDPNNQYYIQSYVYVDNVVLKECKKVGIDEDNNANNVKLYPNPAVGFITVETPATKQEFTLVLYSLTGALVQQTAIKGGAKNKVDVSSLAGGMYIAQVMNGNTVIGRKKVLVNN